MALIKCPECGGTVSSFADKCPHCGHPVDPEKMAAINSQPEPAPQPVVQPEQAAQPIAQPAPQAASTELSAGTIGKGLMMLLSFVGIILLAILVGKAKGGEQISPDFAKFVLGYIFSFVALYFFSRMFVQNSVQQFLGFIIGCGAVFTEVVYLGNVDMSRDLQEAVGLIFLVSLLCVMWFAGAKEGWSKIFFLIAGTLFMAGMSMHMVTSGFDTEVIIITILGCAGLFSMLVGWLVELTLQGNKAPTRFIALIEVVLILTTVLIAAITLKTILDTHADPMERFNKIKLTFIFLMISGASSTFLSLVMPRKRFIYYTSVMFLAAAMMLSMGNYWGFKVNVAGWYESEYVRHTLDEQTMNLMLAGLFFFPISILMSYVADLTKGITSRISFKMN